MSTLDVGDLWSRRFAAWAAERFPFQQVVLLLPLYAAAVLVGKVATGEPGSALPVAPLDVIGFLAFWAFLLYIRVCDEHKDFEIDCRDHPERVLQRGLITLRHLRVVASGAVALMLAVTVAACLAGETLVPLIAWLVAFGWSLLMLEEFFAHDFLEPRLPLYALVHMVITPMMLYWVAALGAAASGRAPTGAPVVLLCALGFASFSSFEVSRKTKAPSEERPTVDSYSKIWGVRGACAVTIAFLAAAGALTAALVAAVLGRLSPGWTVAAVAIAALGIVPFVAFSRTPVADGGKRLGAAIALTTAATYLLVVGAALAEWGLTWS